MEHARTVLGIHGAAHAEYGETGARAVVTPLSCDLSDTVIEVALLPGSRLRALHDDRAALQERTTCRYGLDPSLQAEVDGSGLRVVATDGTGEARAVERTDHPFFVGTLYLPQFSPEQPHPVVAGFVQAALRHSAT